MSDEGVERRLTTILAADVVGYSSLMAADEAGTLTSLQSHRNELFETKTAEYHGRVVKLMGDGTLMEFGSVVDAVDFAVAVQMAMAERNAEVPQDQQITFRIGINIGDVIVEGNDIYGDGVNVAARLEQLADPGGICVTRNVFAQVKNKLDLSFRDMGEQELKNIPDKVRAYQILLGDEKADSAAVDTDKPLPLPDKPSIAVLPFSNMSGDPEQEYFSDGITEDIITELSRFHSLLVLARNSSFSYKGKSVKVQDIGRDLGVAYVVEGSVRKAGNRVRVTAQLIDATTGNHVWADRYDRVLEDIFDVQDELVRTIVSTVGGRIDMAGKVRTARMSDSNVCAYDLYLRAQAAQDCNTKEDYRLAERYLERAIELDPNLAETYHKLSLVKFWSWMVHWAEDPAKTFDDALNAAKKAIALDDTDSMAHANLGMLHIYRREFEEADLQLKKAIHLNPNDVKVLGIYGFYLTAIGNPDRAIEQLDLAVQHNPLEPSWITRIRGIAYLTAGRYDDAISVLKSIEAPINMVRWWLAASYAHAGRLDEARAMLEEFLQVAEEEMVEFPGRTLSAWKTVSHGMEFRKKTDLDHLFDGLRKAGMLE